MFYKRLCRTLNNRGRLLPETDDIWNYIKDDVDYYQSVYKYNEEQYQEFLKTKSVKGVIDVVGSDLIWDFDSASDLEQARQDAFSLITRLLNYGISENAIQIAFSGKKGFGVRVDTNNNLTPKQLRTLTNTIAQGLNYDTSVYNESRVMRVVGTKHNFHKDVLEFKLSTGFTLKEEEQKFYDKLKAGETEEVAFYKFPLTFRQLSTLTIPQILELARDIDNAEIVSWETIDLTEELLQLCRIKEETQPTNATPPSEDSDDPLERINWKDKPKFLSNCRWALQNGYFKPGADSDSPISGRSRALFVLATTYKNLGYSKKQTYYQLKSAADDCAANFGGEKFSKQEIMNNIVEPMYSAGHRGGQCSCKNPDSSELSQWLHKYCNSLGDHKCANDTSKRGFISIADMFAKFDDYVNHIEENTIKTGIDDLDEKIKLRIGQMTAIMGSPGCHAKGTEIVMYDGTLKKVEDIVVGDLLMGPDSQPREVLKLCRGIDKMVKIIPHRSEPFIVNQHHVLHLTPSKKKANRGHFDMDVKVNDYIHKTSECFKGYYKLQRIGVEFTEKNLNIPPYILGLWLGDGHSNTLALTTMDDEIRDEWLNYAKLNNLNVRVGDNNSGKAKDYYISGKNKNVLNTFKSYNLINSKHIPEIYLTSSRKQRLELLAGLLDTDGYLSNNHHYDFVQKNKLLADQVVRLARSLGFHASITGEQKGCWYKGSYRVGHYYRVYISGDNCNEIPCRLPRKIAKKTNRTTDSSHIGFKYEILNEDDYYGFTLDKDHLYLTSDFIVHHNSGKTSMALNILENTSENGLLSLFYSLDMADSELCQKIAHKVTGLPEDEIFRIFQTNDPFKVEILKQISEKYSNVKFSFDTGISAEQIEEDISEFERLHDKKVKLIMVDYNELIAGPHSDPTANSGHIAAQLKKITNKGYLVISLLQPSKGYGDAGTEITTYRAAKGSSLLEQCFSTILAIYRPGFGCTDEEEDEDQYMVVSALKNRMGKLAKINLKWDGARGLITHLDEEGQELLKQLIDKKKALLEKDKDDWKN